MIPSVDLQKATNLSAKTLFRWVDARFLPKPVIGVHPKGRGRTAYWPDWVREYCLEILRLRYGGTSLALAVDQVRSRFTEILAEGGELTGEAAGGLRLIVVFPNFPPQIGGGETHLYQLSQQLASRGFDITVLTQRPHGTVQRESQGKVMVRRFGNASTDRGRKQAYDEILRYLARMQTDRTVLYLGLSVGSEYRTRQMLQAIRLAQERQVPCVIRIPSSGRVTELAQIDPGGVLVLAHCDSIISLNPGITAELRSSGIAPEKTAYIPNGVNVELFAPVHPDRRASIRGRFGSDPDATVLVCPSRFVPKKRLDELVRLWAQILRNRKGKLELWVVGQDRRTRQPQVSRAVTQALETHGAEGVKLLDAVPHSEVPLYYQAASAYISLSNQEGCSNAMLEAMAAGLPVIAPATDAVMPFVREGVNGFLFDPVDRTSALRAIERLLSAPSAQLKSMGCQNRKTICESYTLEQMVDRFVELFNNLAARKGAPGRLDA